MFSTCMRGLSPAPSHYPKTCLMDSFVTLDCPLGVNICGCLSVWPCAGLSRVNPAGSAQTTLIPCICIRGCRKWKDECSLINTSI